MITGERLWFLNSLIYHMSSLSLGVTATSLMLLLLFIWMIFLLMLKKRLFAEKIQRETAYRNTILKAKEQDQQERVFKAEAGHVPTILYLAKEAEKMNLNKALSWYKKAAYLNSITGMYGVIRLSERIRDDINVKQQIDFWRFAIKGIEGDIDAKYLAGKEFVAGLVVEKNIAKGIDWIESAALEGSIPAILYMGEWQSSSHNSASRPNNALFWFMRAAEQGSTEGKVRVAQCYLKGIGTKKSVLNGGYWLERAAEDGNAEAMYLAGKVWLEQKGVGKHIAYIWLFLSTSLGFERAKSLRDDVVNQIGIDVVVELQSIAKPIHQRLSSGTVKPNTIIKVLDKIYKRTPFIFTENVNQLGIKADLSISDAQNLAHISERSKCSKHGHPEKRAVSKEVLDFTQNFL